MIKTRSLIKKQLLTEMETRGIYNIKVKDLISPLNISRSSFYRYFDSVFSVLQEIEDDFFYKIEPLAAMTWVCPPNDLYFSRPHPNILRGINFLRNNKEIIMILIGPNGDQTFQQRFCYTIRQSLFPTQYFGDLQSPDSLYKAAYLVGGVFEMIKCWMEHDCDSSDEQMTLLIYKFIFGNYN